MYEMSYKTKFDNLRISMNEKNNDIDITKYQTKLDHRKIIITHTSGHSGTYKTEMCMW